jgi:hypothetical protein
MIGTLAAEASGGRMVERGQHEGSVQAVLGKMGGEEKMGRWEEKAT